VKIVVDTNVIISGIFFTSAPYQIVRAWQERRVQLCLSAEILQEYVDVAERLAADFPTVDLTAILSLLAAEADLREVSPLPEPVCVDADDDKFLACALAGGAHVVVSGDRHLLAVSGFRGVEVMRPRAFVDTHLRRVGE